MTEETKSGSVDPKIEFKEYTTEEALQHIRESRMANQQVEPKVELKSEPTEPKAEPKVEPSVEPAVEKKADPVTQMTTDTTDWKAEYEKAKSELENKTITRSPKYKNDLYYKLEVIEEQTPEEANLYRKLVFGDPDPKELWKMSFLKENPELKDKPEVVERKFQRTYSALFDSSLTPEDQDYKDAYDDLTLDANKIKKELTKRLDSITVPDGKESEKVQQEKSQKTQQLVDSWKQPFVQLSKDTKFTISIPSETDKSQTESFEFEIPANEQKAYFEKAAMQVLGGEIPYSEKTYSDIKAYVQELYVSKHYNEIAAKIASEISKKVGDAWKKKTTNGDPIKAASSEPLTGAKSNKEMVNEFLSFTNK